MDVTIKHEEEYQQFTIEMGEDDAELAYARPDKGTINFTHTYVPESARGKGIAAKLIEAGLGYARDNHLQVVASCPAVQKYLSSHPEFNDLLKKE